MVGREFMRLPQRALSTYEVPWFVALLAPAGTLWLWSSNSFEQLGL